MLTIRSEQMNVFRLLMEEQFVSRAIAHLQTGIPDVLEQLGEDVVRETIEVAKRKCHEQGIASEQGIIGYLNLMYMLGCGFDEDPRYAALAALLRNTEHDGIERMERVTEQALALLRGGAQ
jgi:hypothetical protein